MNATTRTALLAGCLFFSFAAIQPAQAGFQWTAPQGGFANSPSANNQANNAPAPMMAPRAPSVPMTPVMAEPLPGTMGDMQAGAPIATIPDGPASAAPIYGAGMTDDPITWNQNRTAPQAKTGIASKGTPAARAPQNVLPPETVALYSQTNSPVMAPGNTAAQQAAYSNYTVADGFGSDLPLVMAIRQIVPPQYGFVFDEGIDLSSRVSWQGGRPWDLVLQDTLSPMRLNAVINGNTVSIVRTAAPAQVQANAAPQMMGDFAQNNGLMATPVSMMAPANGMAGPVISDGAMPAQARPVAATTGSDLMASATWTAPRASTLRNILEDWSQRAGVELYWASEYDYPVQSAVNVQGTFEEAVQVLLKGLSDSKPRPLGRLHPNLPNGPAVLVIETRQNAM